MNKNRLILFFVILIALAIIALILTFDGTHPHSSILDHQQQQQQQQQQSIIVNPTKSSQIVDDGKKSRHNQNKDDTAIVLPDFQLESDKTPNEDFQKLYRHFASLDKKNRPDRRYPLPLLVETIKQIHHGIYKIEAKITEDSSSNNNLVKFAFKTECRPASKWHGQQGFSEVLVNWVVKQLFSEQQQQHDEDTIHAIVPYPIGSFTLGAVGGFVQLPEKFEKEIHKDGCGYLTEEQLSQMEFSSSADKKKFDKNLGKILVGVVLQWVPGHRDDAIPGLQFLDPWRIIITNRNKKSSPSSSSSSFKKSLTISNTKISSSVLQMSDIFVLDYIVGNEDRLEKNWFKDSHDRFFAMDNGWALAGMNYAGSVCDLDLQNLKCPPLFRGLANKDCKKDEIVNCRFRKSTIHAVKKFVNKLQEGRDEKNHASVIISNDPLMRYLAQFYGKFSESQKQKKTRRWSDALARFVDSCGGDDDRVGGDVGDDEQERKTDSASSHGLVLDKLIRKGLLNRAKTLLEHVDECKTLGVDEVLL